MSDPSPSATPQSPPPPRPAPPTAPKVVTPQPQAVATRALPVASSAERKALATTTTKRLIESRMADFLASLPRRRGETAADASARVVNETMMAVDKNPALAQADEGSLISACSQAGSMGLSVATPSMNIASLVPYKQKEGKAIVSLIVGYRGLIDLVTRSGNIESVDAYAVYEGDRFEPVYGTSPGIVHVPTFKTIDDAKITHFYAVALLASGKTKFAIMSRVEVDMLAKAQGVGGKDTWQEDYAEMGKKTVIRRLTKTLPIGQENMNDNVAAEIVEAPRPSLVLPTKAEPVTMDAAATVTVTEGADDAPR